MVITELSTKKVLSTILQGIKKKSWKSYQKKLSVVGTFRILQI